MELARPKQNLEIPIEGTQKLKLPKWLPRHELTFFVRYFSRGGAYPIDEALNGMRISFAGEPLPLPKRKAFFSESLSKALDALSAESRFNPSGCI